MKVIKAKVCPEYNGTLKPIERIIVAYMVNPDDSVLELWTLDNYTRIPEKVLSKLPPLAKECVEKLIHRFGKSNIIYSPKPKAKSMYAKSYNHTIAYERHVKVKLSCRRPEGGW